MIQKLKAIWKDPVWSKVISAAILAGLTLLVTLLRPWFVHLRSHTVTAVIALGAFIAALLCILALARYLSRPFLRARLYIYEAGFSHAPVIDIEVRNSTWKRIPISAVEFVTKDEWDMPDPMREGVGVPIESRLPPNSRFLCAFRGEVHSIELSWICQSLTAVA